MGVKVKLADNREVRDKAYKAGDVVEVEPGDARLLLAIGAGAKVADDVKPSVGEVVPEAIPGNADASKDDPAAGDTADGETAEADKGKSGAARRKG